MAACVAIEPIGRIPLGIASHTHPAELLRLVFLTHDEADIAAGSNQAPRDPIDKGKLAAARVAAGQAVVSVMAIALIAPEPTQSGRQSSLAPPPFNAVVAQRLIVHHDKMPCHIDAAAHMAAQREMQVILHPRDQIKAFGFCGLGPMRVERAVKEGRQGRVLFKRRRLGPGIATASAAFTRATNSAYCAAYPAFW